MKIALLFPPQWTAAQPHYALAALNGQLRRAGHQVSIWDLNLGFVEQALAEDSIRRSHLQLLESRDLLTEEAVLGLAAGGQSPRMEAVSGRLAAIETALETGELDDLVARAAAARDGFLDEQLFFDPVRLAGSLIALDRALELASARFHPARIRWNDFSNPACELSLEPILQFCRSDVDNPFRSFYSGWLPRILDERPGLIAISINAFSQVLPGLTLAAMARDALGSSSTAHLSLGGNFFTRLRDALVERPEFFEAFADSLVVGEGEGPVVALAQALVDGGSGLDQAPNLLYLDAEGRLRANEPEPPPPMSELAYQDFTGFRLDRYLAPERVACIRSSKGCYWNRCAFCDAHHGLAPDSVPVERLVDEIRFLGDTFGIRHFELIDECIDAEYLEAMSDALIAADLDVGWFCNARTDPGFTPGLFAKMKRAGATMIMWGIESASGRLLELMDKGVAVEGRLDTLRAAADAGIWNFAFVFFGFPTETEEEAAATIDLLCGNTDVIHSYGRSRFTLGRHSPLVREPERFGILDWVEDDQELSADLGYRVASGIQGQQLTEIIRRCTRRCRQAYGDPLWMVLRSRENLHLYLARHGADWVRNVRQTAGTGSHEGAFH
jgi:hypothetical protein